MAMNWDVIGVIAEVVGAIAVVLSLIYLGYQIRQTRVGLVSTSEDIVQSRVYEAYAPIYEGENYRVFYRGLSGEDLPEDEYFLFNLLMWRQTGAVMDLIEHHRHQTIPETYFEGMISHYKTAIFGYSGAKQWLNKNEKEPVVSEVLKYLDFH